ncbi:hypothetical protein [Paenibacillus physcomitrellae]|uniref:hypothetical protein n=1 Tax=Paenibacillus physcomitrellae TaxID=1619311 RepID=UPI00157F80AD|nr:hypothetical protein [Paenibacillus physcomitrellae]
MSITIAFIMGSNFREHFDIGISQHFCQVHGTSPHRFNTIMGNPAPFIPSRIKKIGALPISPFRMKAKKAASNLIQTGMQTALR